MSYILDALRKSDQQRRRGAAPTLLAVQDAAVEPRQPVLLAYGLLAAVLVGAGVVIGLLRPWQSEQAAPDTPVPVVVKPLESTPREPAPALSVVTPQPKPEPELPTTQAEPAPSEKALPPKPQRKSKTATQPAKAAPAAVETVPRSEARLPARVSPQTEGPPRQAGAAAPEEAAIPAPERPVDIPAADAVGAEIVMSMENLPGSIREALPAMTISVHAYSDKPQARLVGINYRILREGDYVVPGLKLEQITPDGMIFGYKGYRFLRGMK